ncbi:MAG: hypothetical protein ACM36C_17685 [Acidobacteriota bacterium]
MCRGCVSLLTAPAVLLFVVCASAAEGVQADRTIFEVPLPGGLARALATLGDRGAPDRSQFLLEVIRRFYSSGVIAPTDPRLDRLRALTAQLDQAASDSNGDLLPIPLPPALWVDVVLGGRAAPATLVSSILQSRNASLLYCALLSLDESTREWLTGRRDLLAFLSTKRAAAFLVAAPGLRVKNGRIDLPGGDLARPVWLALAGTDMKSADELLERLLNVREGRLAYFLGTLAQLSDAEIRFALRLDLPDPGDRIAAARALYAVFEHVAAGWNIDAAPFWRPPLDPALLVSNLSANERGEPQVPGTRAFWSTVLGGTSERSRPAGPADFGWLCGRVFKVASRTRAREYDQVLFASRHAEWFARQNESEVIEAISSAGRFPALAATLERAGVTDASAFAAASRRASALERIENRARATRAIAQFQGVLALITRAAIRGGIPADSLAQMVISLSAIEPSKEGDYEGRVVQWVQRLAESNNPESLEDRFVRILAGSSPAQRFLDWEGTRYRVDLPSAEATRLARLLGDQKQLFISSAGELIRIAQELADSRLTPAVLRASATAFDAIAHRLGSGSPQDDDRRQYDELGDKLRQAAATGHLADAVRFASTLRILSDSLLAHGVVELAYAAAFGQPGATMISVSEAASRHDFGFERRPGSYAWELPDAGTTTDAWHVRGSLLGLDVRLASFWLMRVSLRPPSRRPSIADFDRRVFTEAVNLVQPRGLTDSEQQTIADALARGRARLASVRSPSDVLAIANDIHLGAARHTLLDWTVLHDPERVASSLSLAELLWLGLDNSTRAGELDGWGAPAEPRLGCLCLKLIERRPWELLQGRWNTGMLAAGFPDLNLRLAELLQELQMPASLLGPVLAAATLDFVDNANARDPDDRRGLVEFVLGLKRERLEEYLALLTTDGPLVPVGEVAEGVRPGRLQ